ncbi:MAG: putative peptidoglycan-binding domain-containing protein [Alphaproteobacteria bacterium]
MTDGLFEKWLPSELKRELDAIAAGRFEPVGRGKSKRARLMQEWLCLHGQGISVDGDFGPATAAAVANFRRAARLPAGETVDATAFEALVRPMTDALQPIAPAGGFSAMTAAYARQHLAQHPLEVGGPNSGPWVRLYMDGNEGEPWAWCAGFVTFLLRQAADSLGERMPIRGSFSCDTLAAQAKEKGLFVAERDREAGGLLPGAIFLNRRTSTDWVHTGIAMGFQREVFETIEGNTNDNGSREGVEVLARIRGYAKKDFIRLP